MAPEFFLPAEVQAITRLRDPTRKRMVNRGLFPRRFRIAPRRVAWRRTDVEAWIADPEGWGKRQAARRGSLMSRGPHAFRQSHITKAIKAAVAAGLPVARVEVSLDGRIVVIAGKPEEGQNSGAEVNEWDAVK